MPYPCLQTFQKRLGFRQDVINSYMCQVFLCRRVNEISNEMYNPQKPVKLEERFWYTTYIEDNVFNKQSVWAYELAFDEGEPPTSDILHMRFRAKYWRAKVILYRPYIEEVMANPRSIPSHATTPTVLQYACKGIAALIKSTEAFQGRRDKLHTITDVFGIAHTYVILFSLPDAS